MSAVESSIIARYRPAVARTLKAYLRQQATQPGPSWQQDTAGRLLSSAAEGKLLRGSLVCHAYNVCSGQKPSEAVLNTAAALELAHASLLIHDDVIDRDETRRHQPALHRQYRDLFKTSAEAVHLGYGLAICAGDMALFMAFELLGRVPTPSTASSLSVLMARELAVTCAGQMQDIYLTAQPAVPPKREIYAMMRAKTAGYSVALPLVAGARLAGSSMAIEQRLQAIGMAAGTLFQIRDDELGAIGLSKQIGKPVGADIREGKKTLLYYYLWRASSPTERRQLTAIFGNAEASVADIALVQQAMRRHRVVQRLQTDINRLRQSADRHIKQLDLPLTARQELQQLVDFCASRQS